MITTILLAVASLVLGVVFSKPLINLFEFATAKFRTK